MKLRKFAVVILALIVILTNFNMSEAVKLELSNSDFAALDPYLGTLAVTRDVQVLPTDVPPDVTITAVKIEVDFHKISGVDCANPEGPASFSSEIEMILTSPAGTPVTLIKNKDAAGGATYTLDDYVPRTLVTFDDAASTLASGKPTFGTFQPAGALSSLIGEDPVGVWSLSISDNYAGDALCFYKYRLFIETTGADPGISVGPFINLQTTEEGGSSTFSIRLNSPPAADVTIVLASSDETEGTITPDYVIFTNQNWNQPQVITITGVDDTLDDNDVPYRIYVFPATSLDPGYNGFDPQDVFVTNLDNDEPTTPTPTSVPPTPTATSPSTSPTATLDPTVLRATATCNGPDLVVQINTGQGNFNILGKNGSLPRLNVGLGTHVIPGPYKFEDVAVEERSGNREKINFGSQIRCYPAEKPVPLEPPHRAEIANAFPTFRVQGIPDGTNYLFWIFDDADVSVRTIDIREKSGGPTSKVLSVPLQPGRYFWRSRGRVNNIWSRWSIRYMFRIVSGAAPDQLGVAGVVTSTSVPPTETVEQPTTAPSTDIPVVDTSGLYTVEAESSNISLNGLWTVRETSAASGGAYVYSNGNLDDSVQVQTVGDRFGLIYVTHPSLATISIEVDGVLRHQIPTGTSEAFNNVSVIDGLGAGEHVIRVYSSDGIIGIDAVLVEGLVTSEPTPLPPTDTSVPPTAELPEPTATAVPPSPTLEAASATPLSPTLAPVLPSDTPLPPPNQR